MMLEVQTAHRILHAIVDSIDSGVLLVGTGGAIHYANRRGVELLNLSEPPAGARIPPSSLVRGGGRRQCRAYRAPGLGATRLAARPASRSGSGQRQAAARAAALLRAGLLGRWRHPGAGGSLQRYHARQSDSGAAAADRRGTAKQHPARHSRDPRRPRDCHPLPCRHSRHPGGGRLLRCLPGWPQPDCRRHRRCLRQASRPPSRLPWPASPCAAMPSRIRSRPR